MSAIGRKAVVQAALVAAFSLFVATAYRHKSPGLKPLALLLDNRLAVADEES